MSARTLLHWLQAVLVLALWLSLLSVATDADAVSIDAGHRACPASGPVEVSP